MDTSKPEDSGMTNSQEVENLEESATPAPPRHLQTALLFLLSLLTIGSHYGKHSLSSLGPDIMRSLGVERTKFGLLFSSQELPGIILPVAGGLALTYVPHGPAAVFLSSCIFVSTALCAAAVTHKSYMSLLVGRFLFGLSDGALTTLQGSLVAHWFKSKVGTGFGAMLLVSRLSSFFGLSIPALVSNNYGLNAAMWFSAAVCVPPLIATILYAVFDARYTPHRMLVDSTAARPRPPGSVRLPAHHVPRNLREAVDFLRSFPVPFWIVCYLWVSVAGSVFSILHFAPDAFSSHFGYSNEVSGLMAGSLVLIAGLSSPAVGILQDRIGRRAGILALSCGLISVGILLCADAMSSAIPGLVSDTLILLVGLCLITVGFAAAPVTLLSCVALTVDDFVTPAALGLYKATENAGLAVLHICTGFLRDESGGYVYSFLLLAALAGSGALAALLLGHLSRPLRQRANELGDDQYEAEVF